MFYGVGSAVEVQAEDAVLVGVAEDLFGDFVVVGHCCGLRFGSGLFVVMVE